MEDATTRPPWTPRSALARFVEIARRDGARTLWFRVWGELCYRRLGLFELALDSPPPPATARMALSMAPLPRDGGGELSALGSSDPDEVDARLSAGHRCYLARSGGRAVGSCWVARGELWSAYLGMRIGLAPDEACTYETFTAPAARGQGVGPALRAWVAAELRREGCRRLLATVEPENAPAIRLVEKLGYRRIGTVGRLGARGRRSEFCRLSAGARRPGDGAAVAPAVGA